MNQVSFLGVLCIVALLVATEGSEVPISEQVSLMSKQLNALMTRRREDYQLLEENLKKFVRQNAQQYTTVDVREEINQLRKELKILREGWQGSNEHLTAQWLTRTIAELRSELAELQQTSSASSKEFQQRTQMIEDISGLREDVKSLRLEIEALRQRQEKADKLIHELRNEAIQTGEDLRRSLKYKNQKHSKAIDFAKPEADHRMRHRRFIRQQLHDLDAGQKALFRRVSELKNQRLGERLQSVETEAKHAATKTFNLSRELGHQSTTMNKMHSSILELLEDVEGIQNKMDKTLPELRREISKVEFNAAQITAQQHFSHEEGQNCAKALQALAVSVSGLQKDADIVRAVQHQTDRLQQDVERLKSAVSLHREVFHSRLEKMESESKDNQSATPEDVLSPDQRETQILVDQLEHVEMEYETIVNKMPRDCSHLDHSLNGFYLIAPEGQHRPIITKCSAGGWSLIQRRHDGSVDFNRSWDEYAQGFGSPSSEFWIGNEALHRLTADNCSSLRIEMQDIYDNTWRAEYSHFHIDTRADGFRLTVAGFSGNASDALNYQNGMQFSAIDDDRDISNTHCATNYEGGWWFSHCQHANLNGRYNLGLTWFDSTRNEWIAVKSSTMEIARRSRCDAEDTTITPDQAKDSTESTSV
ncbi:protein scabrous [Phlebotomus argentipes]|uniref:protein scabrous n=1 Tax=Phlebotomus argentipes TaxID=94469 RepID=UPI0028930E91|nr:protein scabrous [Phlebotomus argentipes]